MINLTNKKRFLTALENKAADRLPVTTHHIMPYFLDKYMNGISNDEFFDFFGFDPILWISSYKPVEGKNDYFDPTHTGTGELIGRRIVSDNWRIEVEEIHGLQYKTQKYIVNTPKGILTTILQTNEYTSWVVKPLIKNKRDIDLIAEYATHPCCDVENVNRVAESYGEKALIRGHVCCFDIYGQPGCWQEAACLFGIENLIMETYDDDIWVHEFLKILKERKNTYINSLKGAKYDVVEIGGGDGSSTVISPKIFNEFVAPYDSELIENAHKAGQRIVYHTCGGMMPILEDIAAMKPDAMETFTPPSMGADVDLKEAKRRIGDKVCMIGGFDQGHFLIGSSPEKLRAEVRRCFEAAGENGGYILCPSDHFFDADIELIKAFVDEAKKCVY